MKISEMLRRAATTETPSVGTALRFDGGCCAIGYLMLRAGVHISPTASDREDDQRLQRWMESPVLGYQPWTGEAALDAFTQATGVDLRSDLKGSNDLAVQFNQYSIPLGSLIFTTFDNACRIRVGARDPFIVTAERLESLGY